MEQKEILERLCSVKENNPLSVEDKEAIKEAIRLVKRKDWKDNLIKLLELLTKLMGIGSKFFDP